MDATLGQELLMRAVPKILSWYRINRRSVPWRDSPTPYGTWISEIMLQQTRISAAIPYYLRFMAEIPGVAELAAASDERLMKLWEGLGYYSRARNLKKAAVILKERYGGTLPASYEELRALPGIGDYTAGAIASIAFGLPSPAVDGNVLRVIMRYLGEYDDIAKASVKKEVTKMLSALYPTGKDASDLTEGLMEIGEAVCVPNGAPLCGACPLRECCMAHKNGLTDILPIKAQKKARTIEKKAVLLLQCNNKFALRKRPDSGLLAGLWEFPTLPLGEDFSLSDALSELGVTVADAAAVEKATHIFSHVEWHMTGFDITCAEETSAFTWVTKEELIHTYALPSAFRVYRKYILKSEQRSSI